MNDYRYPDPNLGNNAVALAIALCLGIAFVMGCLKHSGGESGAREARNYSQYGGY